MTTPSIKEEFAEAYKKEWPRVSDRNDGFDKCFYYDMDAVALWAARWMAERCAKECEDMALSLDNDWNKQIGKRDDLVETAQECADSIRQLASELGGEKV